jgi:hypothetical protein
MLEFQPDASEISGLQFPKSLPVIDPATLDFSNALLAVNRTPRFAIEVPALPDGGEPLVFPPGTPRAGEAMKALADGTPERGIVFFNSADNAWQPVRGNGEESIIINGVDAEIAAKLYAHVKPAQESGALKTVEGILAVLDYARNILGLSDFFHKKTAHLLAETRVLEPENPFYRETTKATIHRAIFHPGAFVHHGPVIQTYHDGAVFLNDGRHVWAIATDVFIKNFRAVNNGEERPLRSVADEFPAAAGAH